ncbi:MAG: sulfatase family protein [Hyphomicrobiales bacterium]
MRPNILFLMADQFRADAVGCVGGYARTPSLDKLASEGCLFTDAFANSAECVPSRISLATGLYPHQTGIDRNVRCTLDPGRPNWMQAIQAAGYRTSLFGKTHLHPHEGDIRDRHSLVQQYGLETVDETTGPRACAYVRSNLTDLWEERNVWDAFKDDMQNRFATKPFVARSTPLPLDLYYDCYVGRAARTYLESALGDRPWFCWVSFGGPHEPWDAPESYARMYQPHDMPAPRTRTRHPGDAAGLLQRLYPSRECSPDLTRDDVAAMRANYAGKVSLIDDEIGQIVDVLRHRGVLDHTLIVFTSDHGEMNGDCGLIYKANFLDPAIKVPLIIVPPKAEGTKSAGVRSPALVELMDVGATLVDYAGSRPPTPLARSLRPLIREGATQHRSTAVSEFAGHTCLITREMKVEFDARFAPVLAFDRFTDHQEQNDVSNDANYAPAIADIGSFLGAFRLSTPTVAAVLP